MSANPTPDLSAWFYDLSVNTIYICGKDLGFQHGVYLLKLRPKNHFTKLGRENLEKLLALKQTRKQIVIWFPESIGTYPLLSGRGVLEGESPTGGARIDLDYPEVASFGVYSRASVESEEYKLCAWYDFDHWPGKTLPGRTPSDPPRFTLDAGLADGHFHPGENTKLRYPCDSNHRLMLVHVVCAVRFGNTFPRQQTDAPEERKAGEKH
jgi:hypothetical protein